MICQTYRGGSPSPAGWDHLAEDCEAFYYPVKGAWRQEGFVVVVATAEGFRRGVSGEQFASGEGKPCRDLSVDEAVRALIACRRDSWQDTIAALAKAGYELVRR